MILACGAFGENLVPGEVNGGHRGVIALRHEDVLWDIDQHGAGASAGGDVKRFMHDLGQLGHVLDHEVVLGAGAGDAEGIRLLEGVAANEGAVDLAGDGDDGDGIHHGVHQAGDQVGGARSGGGAADADFARGAGVAFGGEGGVLLMAHQDVADVVVVERVVKRKGHAAGVAEEAFDPFLDHAFQQDFGATHQVR